MPAYNLAGTIGAAIERVVRAAAPLERVEIVVADDGSRDGTRREAEEAAARFDNVLVVGHEQNRGKGAALVTAFSASSLDTVVFLDADLDLPPEQVPGFVQRLYDEGVDALVGTKQAAMDPGRYPQLRRMLSRIFSGVVKVLFRLPIAETQTGLKAFRRAALTAVVPRLTVERYTYDLELLVLLDRSGFTMRQAPVELALGASSSGVSVRTLWEMGRDTLRIWLRAVSGRI